MEQAIAGGSTTDPAHGLSNRRGMRRIFFAQSRDFHHWSEPRLALAPDPELDNLDDSFYCMRPYRLGSHWVGFLGVLNMTTRTMFPQLAYSRDARQWDRLRPTHAWIESGGKGSFGEFIVAAPHMVDVGDESWFYFGGAGALSARDRSPLRVRTGQTAAAWLRVGRDERQARGDAADGGLHRAGRPAGDQRVLRAAGPYQGGGGGT